MQTSALKPRRRLAWQLLLLAGCCAVLPVLAQEKPAAPPAAAPAGEAAKAPPLPPITVKLVADFESATPVSDLEVLEEIKQNTFGSTGSSEVTLGTRAVLWVRNAHVDGKFFFERYYQEKYIGRQATLEIDAALLGPGEHVLEPGGHRFTYSEQGELSSTDPDIRIQGRTVLLKMHKVNIFPVDGAKTGPAEFRKTPATLGLFRYAPDQKLDPAALPNPTSLFNPLKPPAEKEPVPVLTNLLSHQAPFFPLSVWLPSNTQGQGYLLYPSWQAFQVTPQGEVLLSAADAPRVPGIEVAGTEAEKSSIVIPYREVSGRVRSHTGLSGGVGSEQLSPEMRLGPTLEQQKFRAGLGEKPPEDFFLLVDNDLTKRPHKFFVADNTLHNPEQIRLLAVEWDAPIFTRGAEAKISARMLETPAQPPLAEPEIRLEYSLYNPSLPTSREWQPVAVTGWQRENGAGELAFRAPDVPFAFVAFRLQVFAKGDTSPFSPLAAEWFGTILEPGQLGTASLVSNKGRNAFVCGEEIRLDAVLRSSEARTKGQRQIKLVHPNGQEETLAFEDAGTPWFSQGFQLSAERTRQLAPGRYQLSVTGLPEKIVGVPYVVDLTARQPASLFHVVKPSKYTDAMNNLEPSHLQGSPINLDRAMNTIARLGYTRVDLMSYMTNRHQRAYTWRESLAAGDERLPPPAAVFSPSPRDQMLNAAVREGLQFSDVWLSYGDFHLPRSIEPYVKASERWIARETQAMRHSPAYDGMILYDEMYQQAVTGIVPHHQKYFAKVRARLVEEKFGLPPAKIEAAFNRYLERPRSQRDPEALESFIAYKNWQQESWAEYVNRMVPVAKRLAPGSRYGTYLRTWLLPGSNDDMYNGYPPSLFRDMDIISHVHYADNSTCWVSIPLLAQAIRTGTGKTLYVNLPLTHEVRTEQDGQYQRHMAFALLQQGANGVCHWGLQHTFTDGANAGTAQGYETTGHLNRDILRPFGEINDRTTDGYGKVGIVSIMRQHALSENKRMAQGNETEAIWIACWRLGYPAVFVREEQFAQPLDGYSVLFVPGVRFDNELDEAMRKRLEEAIAAGTKVVVEAESALDLPGAIKLDDWQLTNYYVGTYFPTWMDDELNKVYGKSQATVDYLRPKFAEWGIEPAARGAFQVGPTWRDGGDIDYLWMANFDDPAYNHTVKQQMVKPLQLPLTIPARHGRTAYDLLAQQELPVTAVEGSANELGVTLDMRRLQGALVAFTPEPIEKLEVQHAVSADSRVKLTAQLIGKSGKGLDATFPVQVTMTSAALGVVRTEPPRTFYRMLGRGLSFELDLPAGPAASPYQIEIREALSGRTVKFAVASPVLAGPSLVLEPREEPLFARRNEVYDFLTKVGQAKQVQIIPAAALPGALEVAEHLAKELKQHGITAQVVAEASAYHLPLGNPQDEDPLGDGFHSWRLGQELIGPSTIVDSNVILLGAPGASLLLDTLQEHGMLSDRPYGGVGRSTRPLIERVAQAFHYDYDALCLVAGDEAGLRQNADALLKLAASVSPEKDHRLAEAPRYTSGFPRLPVLPEPKFAGEKKESGNTVSAVEAAVSFAGTNELVMDAQYDEAGNLYVITWGHGKNLYSFAPDGKFRFSRLLPEMGTNRLEVLGDRLLAYTAAGARLYEMSLEGEPRKQVRLNMDPGSTHYEDNYHLSHADYTFLPATKQYLHKLKESMRVLDENFKVLHEWKAEAFVDKDVDDKTHLRELYSYAVSPDGQRIAQIEASYYFTKIAYQDVKVYDAHLVVRDNTGKLIAEYKNVDNRSSNGQPGVTASVSWPAGSAGPVVYVENVRWTFSPDLQQVEKLQLVPGQYGLGGDKRLVRDGRTLIYYDKDNHAQCRLGPLSTMPTYLRLSTDGSLLAMLDEYGSLSVYQTSDGQRKMQVQVGENGRVLRFTPNGQQLLLAGMRGGLRCFALDGTEQWHARLEEFNDVLGPELPLYDPAFADFTPQLWPVSQDSPGELEALVRVGENRLTNGDVETDGVWQGEQVVYAGPGFESSRALRVGPALVSQEVKQFLGSHVTWVLEFRYRLADAATVATEGAQPGPKAELLAGLMSECDFPDSVARTFHADAQWRFGRVVIKNGANCQKLMAGFSAAQGDVLVDQVTLRRLRFPSVNHLLYEPLYPIKPIVLDNPLFSEQYDPFGNVREEAPNRVLIEALRTGALNLVEAAFLQNGRTSEIGSQWFIQPFDHDPVISLGLREPRWVSMVGLYFNVYDEKNIAPHFNIYATDMATNEEVLVASVRHNGQLFRLIKFPPIKTALVRVEQVHSIARLRTVTEIELYGPLSGREGTPGFVDADGQNAYLGDFTRVDKRVKQLADWYQRPMTRTGGHAEEIIWHAPLTQPLLSAGKLFLGRTLGVNTAVTLADPAKDLYFARAGGLGYSPYGALYGGLIFRCGNDGVLYCIDPESGTQLWSVQLGERLFGSPVAIGEDLFVASDNFKLYAVDFAGGSILKEREISGLVLGSLATDGTHLFLITDDGFLNCIRAGDFQTVWQVPVAQYTDSTPVVDAGLVYLADQKGTALAVRVADGGIAWKAELGAEFMRAPVVGPDKILFGCRNGTLVVLNRADGQLVWKKEGCGRFFHEPLLVHTADQKPAAGDYGGNKVLFFRGARCVLANLTDGAETTLTSGGISADRKPASPEIPVEEFTLPNEPLTPLGFYKGTIVAIPRTDHTGYNVVYPWHVQGGQYTVMNPVPIPAPEPAPVPAEGAAK